MICNKKIIISSNFLFVFLLSQNCFNQILIHILFLSRASTINLQCGTSKCASASARCTKALHPETSWDFSVFRVCLRSFGWRCSHQICYVDSKDPEKSAISTYDHVSTQPQSNVPAIHWKCLTHLTQKLSKHVQCDVFFGGWNRRCAYIFQSEQGRSNLPELITNQDDKAIVERLDEVCTCLAVQTESIKISFQARTFSFSWYEMTWDF